MTQFFSRNWSTGTPEKVTAGAELVRSKIPSDGASDGPFSPKLDRPVTRFQRLRLWSINAKGLITDEGVAVAGVPRCGDRDPSAGGETHERSIRSGCSPAVQDRATEVVATGSARQVFRERRLP